MAVVSSYFKSEQLVPNRGRRKYEIKEARLTIERLALKEVLQMFKEEFASQLGIREIRWSKPDYIPEKDRAWRWLSLRSAAIYSAALKPPNMVTYGHWSYMIMSLAPFIPLLPVLYAKYLYIKQHIG